MKSIKTHALLTGDTIKIEEIDYNGNRAVLMNNGIISLNFHPDAGGRLMQVSLAGHDFLWENEELQAVSVPQTGLGENGSWMNWGGEKIWPSPQGWRRGFFQNYCRYKGLVQEDWNAGPPMAEIDGMPWSFEINEKDLKMQSLESVEYGIRFYRDICIFDNSSRINFYVEMENTDERPHRWGIWTNSQLEPEGRDIVLTVPINKNSIYPEGFAQQFGLVGTEQAMPDYENMLLNIQYKNEVAKFGLDSDGGWLAAADRTSGKTYIKTFSWEEDRQYPDNSSVEVWLNGSGYFYGFDKKISLPSNETAFVEAELLGPLAKLSPGEKTSFSYDIYATTICPGENVLSVTEGGAVAGPSYAEYRNSGDSEFGKMRVTASYGVFYTGELFFRMFKCGGVAVSEISTDIYVSPDEYVEIKEYQVDVGCRYRIESVGVYIEMKGGSEILLDQITVG